MKGRRVSSRASNCVLELEEKTLIIRACLILLCCTVKRLETVRGSVVLYWAIRLSCSRMSMTIAFTLTVNGSLGYSWCCEDTSIATRISCVVSVQEFSPAECAARSSHVKCGYRDQHVYIYVSAFAARAQLHYTIAMVHSSCPQEHDRDSQAPAGLQW